MHVEYYVYKLCIKCLALGQETLQLLVNLTYPAVAQFFCSHYDGPTFLPWNTTKERWQMLDFTFYSVKHKLVVDTHGAICEICNTIVHVFSYGYVTLLIGKKSIKLALKSCVLPS